MELALQHHHAGRLRELGAAVIEAPAIRIRPLDAELPEPAAYDLLCVTSPSTSVQPFRAPRPPMTTNRANTWPAS